MVHFRRAAAGTYTDFWEAAAGDVLIFCLRTGGGGGILKLSIFLGLALGTNAGGGILILSWRWFCMNARCQLWARFVYQIKIFNPITSLRHPKESEMKCKMLMVGFCVCITLHHFKSTCITKTWRLETLCAWICFRFFRNCAARFVEIPNFWWRIQKQQNDGRHQHR